MNFKVFNFDFLVFGFGFKFKFQITLTNELSLTNNYGVQIQPVWGSIPCQFPVINLKVYFTSAE